MNKIINPTENILDSIYQELIKYPFTFEEIIDVVLRTQTQINESLDPSKNLYYYYICPMKEGSDIGGCYENGIRHRFNLMGKIIFTEGEHNSGKDLDHPEFGTEIKTRQNLQFNNTNDNGRTHDSTKYIDGKDDEESYYILVQQNFDTNKFPYTTTVKKIFFGMLSKKDFTNPNGTGAAYLKADIRNMKCIEIWNNEIGNTIETYQGYLDQDYYDHESELINNI